MEPREIKKLFSTRQIVNQEVPYKMIEIVATFDKLLLSIIYKEFRSPNKQENNPVNKLANGIKR